jgi:hypothetical protein
MRASSSANEASTATGYWFARRAAMLGTVLLIDCLWAGCNGCRPKHDAADDARAVAHDGDDRQDGGPGLDADAAVSDGGDRRDGGADSGSGHHDAGSDATSAICPPWRPAAAAGHGWLYARALSSTGVPLTAGANHVDIYVRRAGDSLPGERADADDPCAVASYEQTAAKVRVLAAAIGFSSQEREFSPQACLETTPCSIELPQSLDAGYYRTTSNRVILRVASDVPQGDQVTFAAAVAKDALARSKALQHPLADELDSAGKATNVPALDLAIHYTEAKLRKKCDASCLDEPSLDPAVRNYLKGMRRPAHTNPFALRTAPNRWQRP